jgi:soluble lytic murein transglycosylase-like protein
VSNARLLLPLLALTLGLASPAGAQIYSWRDANGNLVLSNRPPVSGTTARTFAVDRTPELRTTRPPAQGYRNTYDALIEREAAAQGVRPGLVRAVMQVESGFNPRARSARGAIGLMQLMPATAAQFRVTNVYDPAENTRAGVAYLRQLLDRYRGNEELALAAYNAGPEAVGRYGNQVPPYQETRDYLRRVQTRTRLGASPAAASGPVIYKTWELIDGRLVPKFSNNRPRSGAYEVIVAR